MKTKLVIRDDLKEFLHEEKNRLTPSLEAWYKLMGHDCFDWQWLFKFDNGYGASVVKFYGSYGFNDDLFELAVIKWVDNTKYILDYYTSITDNVEGYLTNDEVMDLLERIKNLKGEDKNEN